MPLGAVQVSLSDYLELILWVVTDSLLYLVLGHLGEGLALILNIRHLFLIIIISFAGFFEVYLRQSGIQLHNREAEQATHKEELFVRGRMLHARQLDFQVDLHCILSALKVVHRFFMVHAILPAVLIHSSSQLKFIFVKIVRVNTEFLVDLGHELFVFQVDLDFVIFIRCVPL